MNQRQIRELIDHILKKIDLYSEQSSELVFLTGLVESRYEYIRQMGKGPACSPFQVESATAYDVCKNYLVYKKALTKMKMNGYSVLDGTIPNGMIKTTLHQRY